MLCTAGACHYPTKINSSAINQVEWPSLIRRRFLPSKKIRIHRNNRLASSSSPSLLLSLSLFKGVFILPFFLFLLSSSFLLFSIVVHCKTPQQLSKRKIFFLQNSKQLDDVWKIPPAFFKIRIYNGIFFKQQEHSDIRLQVNVSKLIIPLPKLRSFDKWRESTVGSWNFTVNKSLSIEWAAGHRGFEGNEVADLLVIRTASNKSLSRKETKIKEEGI